MRKLFGGLVLAAALLSLPAAADAQRRAAAAGGAKYEFGVDAGLSYYDPDIGASGIRIGTPLDVRVGFVTPKKLQWEPRLGFAYDSKGTDPDALYAIQPGVNVVYAMNQATNRRGMYLTGGVGLNLVGGGGFSGTGFGFNGAIGWRKPFGNAAWRYEVGISYDGEVSDGTAVLVAKTFSFGGRFGISFWN